MPINLTLIPFQTVTTLLEVLLIKGKSQSNWSNGVNCRIILMLLFLISVYADGKSTTDYCLMELLPCGEYDRSEANAEVNINKSSSLTVKNDLNVNPGGLLLVGNGGSNGAGHGNLYS